MPKTQAEYSKEYRLRNLEKCRERDRVDAKARRDRLKADGTPITLNEEQKQRKREKRTERRMLLKAAGIETAEQKWARENKEKLNEKSRLWRESNPEKVTETQRKYQEKNAEKKREYARQRRQKLIDAGIDPNHKRNEEQRKRNRDYARERRVAGIGYEKAKEWREKNRVKINENQNKWRFKNRDRANEHARKASLKRRLTPWGAIKNRLWGSFHDGLKGMAKSSKYERYLGYSWVTLRRHIISQFTDGMTWELLIVGEIHIDHIKPLRLFKYESLDCPTFKEAWALSNLQPLWKRDNLVKGGKYATNIV